MMMWIWIVGLGALLVGVAMWIDHRRRPASRHGSADLPPGKKGTATESMAGWDGPGSAN